MIELITMYHAACDGCEEEFSDSYRSTLFGSKESVLLEMPYWGWHEIDGKLYCPECIEKLIEQNKHGN